MRTLFRMWKGAPAEVELTLVRFSHTKVPDPDRRPTWALDMDDIWMHYDGEGRSKGEYDQVIQRAVVVGGAWATVEWGETDMIWPGSESGWLGPDGAWFGCSRVWHEVVAALVLRLSPEAAHATYARVHSKSHVSLPTTDKRLTAPQRAWLKAHGYVVGDDRPHEADEVKRWVEASGRPLRGGRDGG